MFMFRNFVFAVAFVSATAVYADSVVFSGSSTIQPIMEMLEPTFEEQGLDLQIQGGGSSAGLKSISAGMAHIAMVSRELTKSESAKYKVLPIAKDWLVMIGHTDAPVFSLSKQEIYDLYTGRADTWPGTKTNIHLIAKESGRATKTVFDEHFMLMGKLRPDLLIIGANGQAIMSVAADPNALAYVSYSAAVAAIEQGESIKILAINGIDGTPEHVASGEYQLTRTLNLVYLPDQQVIADTVARLLALPQSRDILVQYHVLPL